MIIKVDVCEGGNGEFVARVYVDKRTIHVVRALSKVGALAALSSLCEADLDKKMAIHVAVKASLQDTVVATHKPSAEVVFDASRYGDGS